MKQKRSLYDVVSGIKKPIKKSYRKLNIKPIPIGHHLAVKIYWHGVYFETLFVDNIDICNNYTMIHYNSKLMEPYPVRHEGVVAYVNSISVMYENETEFEIIRIS